MRKFIPLLLILLLFGCSEPSVQDFPVLRTLAPGDVDETGATFRAEVLQTGKVATTSYGFVWDSKDPATLNSNKIVVGASTNDHTFEKRIDYSLAKGLSYQVRAFATYGGKTVYGNISQFKSKGSEHGHWALELEDIRLEGWFTSYGSSTAESGHVLFQNGNHFVYDPETNSFSGGPAFPASGNSGTQFTSVLINNAQYFFSSINRNVHRLENGSWLPQGQLPFNYGSFGGYYHGHAASNNIYLLSSSASYSYDPVANAWGSRSRIPISSGYSVGGVSLNDKAYVMITNKNLWEYNVVTNSWTLKTQYPGRLNDRIVSFAYGNKIYMGLSHYDHFDQDWFDREFWSYDPVQDKWELQEMFPVSLEPHDLFFFALDNKLYIGHGFQNYVLWSFDPAKL